MKIGVITYEDKGAYPASIEVNEDIILENMLQDLGLDYQFEIWSDPAVDWSRYNLLLIKSPWDYFDRYAEFLTWCEHIKKLGIPSLNDMDTILWNSDKWYLREIQEKGFPIVPTRYLKKKEKTDIGSYFKDFDTHQIIIKPTVSGGAKNTLKLQKDTWQENEEIIAELLQKEDFMIQPFVEEVARTGEYSYIFFNGKFSHAVLKSPKKGEFRVQHFFGGAIHVVEPNADQLEYLQKMVDSFAGETLYARVDGVWTEGVFYLMELELIEPYLFLFTSEKAKENYKMAIEKRIQRYLELD
ncbi:ATP-grasp domain-containing protein [Shivajiella indica]|uniref:RimK family alpha-L-glutamate ligase n=1 Tax=Shivajiella indica TaxID=872115 RepID=A0ABW5BAK4_9BACT